MRCYGVYKLVLQEILQTRFPMPRYIVTEHDGSQVSHHITGQCVLPI